MRVPGVRRRRHRPNLNGTVISSAIEPWPCWMNDKVPHTALIVVRAHEGQQMLATVCEIPNTNRAVLCSRCNPLTRSCTDSRGPDIGNVFR